MSTCRHIIIHKQDIIDGTYIRIIKADSKASYINELQRAYGKQDTIQHDIHLHVLYNAADLYDRLLQDVKFKKFKGVQSLDPLCEGIWCLDPGPDTPSTSTWYEDTYIQWIKNKLQSYIDDMDEDYFAFDPKTIDWRNIDVCTLTTFTKETFTYYINKYERSDNPSSSSILLTKDHILSLTLQYLKCSFEESNSENDPIQHATPPSPDPQLVITDCTSLRGVFINKPTLTPSEVYILLQHIGYPYEFLKKVSNSSQYKDYLSKHMLLNRLTTDIPIFKSYYSFYDENKYMFTSSTNDLQIPTLSSNTENLPPVQLAPQSPSPPQHHNMLFKNIVNNNIHAFETDFTYLKEFDKLSPCVFKTTFVNDIIRSFLNKSSITCDIIDELAELVDIFKKIVPYHQDQKDLSAQQDEPPKQDIHNSQYFFTKFYVDLYKNDNCETLAIKAIDNVYKFLDVHNVTNINKNQIGKDLVDLCVKKIRKAKGFVYGIEDVVGYTPTSAPLSSFPVPSMSTSINRKYNRETGSNVNRRIHQSQDKASRSANADLITC